ncbi:dentin sialophosphoprotein-like, partial [Trifolium medium]|nr:dentin sialophosphoprotein-like [Trifolium medium]
DEFGKLGVDLENAERSGNQDRYDDIAAQIRESYRRCGSRHMRLKKIFLVLHEELLSTKQRIKDFADWYRDRD